MRELISIFLPVIWAIVATGIGLLLYKSSGAIFTADTTQAKGIRLTGSAAIAAVAFFGMKLATPLESLQVSRLDQVLVSVHKLEAAAARADTLEEELIRASGDAVSASLTQCREGTGSARVLAGQLVRQIEEMRPDQPAR